MKKRFATILLALVMCLSLLPTAAFAAQSFEKTYFPGGKISTPKAPYLVYEKNDTYGDAISMWYNPSEELRALNAAYDRYLESGKEYEDYFGVYEYNISIQIDAKIDNGSWQYTSDWDNNDWSGLDNPHYLAYRTCCRPDSSAFLAELTLSDLHYLGDDAYEPAFLSPIVYTSHNEYGEDTYHYDLSGHTLSVRYRYAVCISPEYGEYDMVFSDWSPVTSIGKNSNQKTHTAPTSLAAPVLSDFSIVKHDNGGTSGKYFVNIPDSVYDAVLYCEADRDAFEPMYLQAQMRVNGGAWADVYTANPCDLWDGYRSASPDGEKLKESDAVEVRVRIESDFLGMVSPWSNIVGTNTTYQASIWAQNEIQQADAIGLIPDCLVGADLTKNITRAEFAAVSVKLYEAITGKTATATAPTDRFTDCKDAEVLKAVALGITNGTGDGSTFSPNVTLNRETAATMLTRTYKTALGIDTLSFTMPAKFADDAKISSWAYESVYFMAANGILKGGDGNKVMPQNYDNSVKVLDYANATREQALLMAFRVVDNLK